MNVSAYCRCPECGTCAEYDQHDKLVAEVAFLRAALKDAVAKEQAACAAYLDRLSMLYQPTVRDLFRGAAQGVEKGLHRRKP